MIKAFLNWCGGVFGDDKPLNLQECPTCQQHPVIRDVLLNEHGVAVQIWGMMDFVAPPGHCVRTFIYCDCCYEQTDYFNDELDAVRAWNARQLKR